VKRISKRSRVSATSSLADPGNEPHVLATGPLAAKERRFDTVPANLPEHLIVLYIALGSGATAGLGALVLVTIPMPWSALMLGMAVALTTGLLGWAAIEGTVFARLRRIEKRLRRTAMERGLVLSDPTPDPIADLDTSATELLSVIQRELVQMQEMENYRREFIGDVSHELKTPLFAIQGFIETLIDGALADPQVNLKFLKQALTNVDRLSSLVEDLMVISQIESGELTMRMESS
jgi:two-component system, OmpR family, phosphate regulon sensor histidine kinase PhoR